MVFTLLSRECMCVLFSWPAAHLCRVLPPHSHATKYCAETSTHITSLGGCHTDACGRDLCDTISSVGLLVLNSGELTFIRRSAASTVIDLTLVSQRCSLRAEAPCTHRWV
ncbi:hypothetical protein MRX96_010931 [Rhipicephalus microplus]